MMMMMIKIAASSLSKSWFRNWIDSRITLWECNPRRFEHPYRISAKCNQIQLRKWKQIQLKKRKYPWLHPAKHVQTDGRNALTTAPQLYTGQLPTWTLATSVYPVISWTSSPNTFFSHFVRLLPMIIWTNPTESKIEEKSLPVTLLSCGKWGFMGFLVRKRLQQTVPVLVEQHVQACS